MRPPDVDPGRRGEVVCLPTSEQVAEHIASGASAAAKGRSTARCAKVNQKRFEAGIAQRQALLATGALGRDGTLIVGAQIATLRDQQRSGAHARWAHTLALRRAVRRPAGRAPRPRAGRVRAPRRSSSSSGTSGADPPEDDEDPEDGERDLGHAAEPGCLSASARGAEVVA